MIVLRPVVAADSPFLLEVYSSTRADELAVVPWTAEQKRDFIEMQSRAQSTDYLRRFPASDHSIIEVDGVPVGRIWIARTDDEIRLLDIAILPEHRSRGTGRYLLEQLISEAQAKGAALRHTVDKGNGAARRLYERLGFAVVADLGVYLAMEWSGLATRLSRPD